MPRRRVAIVVAGAMAALGSWACVALPPTRWRLGRDEVNAMVWRQFPRRQRVLDSIDLTLSNPVVGMVAADNRLRTELTFQARVSALLPTVSGLIVLLHQLRFEPKDGTVRLHAVEVQRLQVESTNVTDDATVRALVSRGVSRALEGVTIHTLGAEQLKLMRDRGMDRVTIHVLEDAVEIRFGEQA
jgi:hypothetical protein